MENNHTNYLHQFETELDNEIEKYLVAFGNFLLQRRKDGFVSEQNHFVVTDADLYNWKEKDK